MDRSPWTFPLLTLVLVIMLSFNVVLTLTLTLSISLALTHPPRLTLVSLLVNHHVLDRKLDNQTLLLTKQRGVVVQPAETSQSVRMSRVFQETISLRPQLLGISVDTVLGPDNLGLFDKHALVPSLCHLVRRKVSTLSILDLVLELLNGLHSQLAEILLVHLDGQVADRKTGLGDIERRVTGKESTACRERSLALGQLSGQDRLGGG
jgi:hypothetical protein